MFVPSKRRQRISILNIALAIGPFIKISFDTECDTQSLNETFKSAIVLISA